MGNTKPGAFAFRTLITFALALRTIAAAGVAQPAVQPPPSASKLLTTVLELERSKAADTLVLRDGEELSATILNESFNLRTAYADLKIERRWIAGIDLGAAAGTIESVITVNSNRFSGFLSDSAFVARLADGKQTEIRREKVLKAVFRIQEGESDGTPRNQFVFLKNGDFFTGKVMNESLVIASKTNRVSIRPSEMASATFVAGSTPFARIRLLNGDVVQGVPETDDIEIQLDLGWPVRLYRDRIALISVSGQYSLDTGGEAPAGQNSDPSQTASKPAAANTPEGMVWIPPGKARIGSPTEEIDRGLDEGPQSEIKIPHGFWMGKCEVTQGEYHAVMGINPSHFIGEPARPVEKVSWQQAVEYCSKLTAREQLAGRLPAGYAYRLPTEVEWEYACRAGTTTRFSYGDDPGYSRLTDYAWFTGNAGSTPHPVGGKRPNAWGLYDMHGNVWEWCLDHWSGPAGNDDSNPPGGRTSSLRSARGGSWLYDGRFCRSANRDDYYISNRCSDVGFRVVLAPLEP